MRRKPGNAKSGAAGVPLSWHMAALNTDSRPLQDGRFGNMGCVVFFFFPSKPSNPLPQQKRIPNQCNYATPLHQCRTPDKLTESVNTWGEPPKRDRFSFSNGAPASGFIPDNSFSASSFGRRRSSCRSLARPSFRFWTSRILRVKTDLTISKT